MSRWEALKRILVDSGSTVDYSETRDKLYLPSNQLFLFDLQGVADITAARLGLGTCRGA